MRKEERGDSFELEGRGDGGEWGEWMRL